MNFRKSQLGNKEIQKLLWFLILLPGGGCEHITFPNIPKPSSPLKANLMRQHWNNVLKDM